MNSPQLLIIKGFLGAQLCSKHFKWIGTLILPTTSWSRYHHPKFIGVKTEAQSGEWNLPQSVAQLASELFDWGRCHFSAPALGGLCFTSASPGLLHHLLSTGSLPGVAGDGGPQGWQWWKSHWQEELVSGSLLSKFSHSRHLASPEVQSKNETSKSLGQQRRWPVSLS